MNISRLAVSVCVAGALTTVAVTLSGSGQDKPLDKRVADLEAAQKDILKELQEIRALLQTRVPQAAAAALPSFDLDVTGAAVQGKADAKFAIVEFSAFECAFCGRYARETFAQVERDYVSSGKVRYAFRHFPLERLHPRALRAAEAADCANQQGKFWPMHDRLFANQQALGESDLTQSAQALGLNMTAFQKCMAVEATTPARVRQDQNEGTRAGIRATPTFFIGTIKDGKVHVLKKIVGAQPYSAFKTAIDAVLSGM